MKNKGIAATEPESKPHVNFSFPLKGKVQPDGLEGCGIDDDVTVIVKGKLTSFDKSRWDQSKNFGIEPASCEVLTSDKEVSLEAAIKKADKDRKRL